MKRLEKLAGFGNVQMVEVERPAPGPDQVLVKVKRSLISQGSELFRRYVREEAVSPDIMGYSDVGEIVEAGRGAGNLAPGQRVMVNAPHAQYVLGGEEGDRKRVFPLPDEMSDEAGTFLPLATSAVMWMRTTPVAPGDTVVVLGQGIVGSLCAQVVRQREPGRVIVVDAQAMRCGIAEKFGFDAVIDVSKTDSVSEVGRLTGGKGADVVIECVGGHSGIESFKQAQEMLSPHGVIHLIALYQGAPLPLNGDFFMNKMLIAGSRTDEPREKYRADAARMIVDGRIRVSELITHRLPWEQTPDAYHMLYNRPNEALGVVLEWD